MSKRGFTIIEVLIAIFIVTTGILGIIFVIQRTTSYLSLSSSRLVATYLVQEGIEIVRNIRDTNWLNGRQWNFGLEPGEKEADYNDQSLSNYGDNYLKFDNGFYNYETGNDTKFKRKITLSDPGPACQDRSPCLSAKVEVSWQQLGQTHKVVAEEYLYNWLEP
jgi:type II secretory pathway pseudopilin PulG